MASGRVTAELGEAGDDTVGAGVVEMVPGDAAAWGHKTMRCCMCGEKSGNDRRLRRPSWGLAVAADPHLDQAHCRQIPRCRSCLRCCWLCPDVVLRSEVSLFLSPYTVYSVSSRIFLRCR